MTTRIYLVTDKSTNKPRLVRAGHPAPALRHVADAAFTVRVASQDDLLKAIEAGVKVESIAAEQQELPAT
jgi:hypothetical protein